MKLALFQMSAIGDHATRPARIKDAMQTASDNGADLLIAPELALSGYGRGAAFDDLTQEADGNWSRELTEIARSLGISLIAGFPETRDGTHHISALAIDARSDAAPVIYRKTCLYGDYEKQHFVSPGPSTIIADLGGLRVGILICFDIEFPENARRLARAGAQLIAVPTALPQGASGAFIAQHVIRTRAFENQIFIAYANHADSDEAFTYQGCSSIAAPDGAVLAQAPETGDALLYAEITPEAYEAGRAENPYLADSETLGLHG
ncbi:carbon-nitrogen hydrolase family protein [Pseudohalocynthiibacter aestuariivivens]|nr:carbon-nitrogen hydrolase family protein [Pseudohalocynthiibacter aestuariivivens]QIE44255.1 carbon-nitrogen hydrolase family protein [Pseudohalocynthiibacter aestuariivivens]